MYGYAIPLFYECYMRHGPRLIGVNQSTDHSMTSNYTLGMLACYPGFWTHELESCTSVVGWWFTDDGTRMDVISHYFMSIM